MDFAISTDQRVKLREREKREKYLDLVRKLKKTMEHESVTNCNWCARNNPQKIGKGTGRIRTQRTSGDHPD